MCVSLLSETPWHYCDDRKSRINHHPSPGFTLCTHKSHVRCPIQPSNEIISRLGTAVFHALNWQMCVSPSQLLPHGIWWPFGNPSFLTENVYFYSLMFSFSICAISTSITSLIIYSLTFKCCSWSILANCLTRRKTVLPDYWVLQWDLLPV